VKQSEGNAVDINVSEPVNPSGAYTDTPIPPKINNQSIDNSVQDDIIKENEVHYVGDETVKPYNENFSYDARVTDDVRTAVSEEHQLMEEKFGKIDTVSGVDLLKTAGTDEGAYSDHSRMISLRHVDEKKALSKMAIISQEKKSKGMWSTGHPRHAIRHEIGHAIQLSHKENDAKWNDKLTRIDAIFKKAIANEDGYALPSIYSGKKRKEFISECIAASMMKKQSKTVRDVINIITEV
jgi:hypothetical protein